MEVTIQDNGQGFDLEKVTSQGSTIKGLGLSSMKERTELSGGSFVIESILEEGNYNLSLMAFIGSHGQLQVLGIQWGKILPVGFIPKKNRLLRMIIGF